MIKSIFEILGGEYEQQGDYLIPCLTIPAEEEQAIGIWGQRHLNYPEFPGKSGSTLTGGPTATP